jgi:hypothetical protein
LLITLTLLSSVVVTILTLYLTELHASYHIGTDPIGLESTPSFDEANFSSSLKQGKHLASSLNRIFTL